MIKAINLSTYQYDMDRYNNNYKNVNKFLEDNNINGKSCFWAKFVWDFILSLLIPITTTSLDLNSS